MAALGPFGARPLIALALSGGPDSSALAWLLARWLAGRQGRLVALIVDHGLRANAADEAARTAAFWQERGVAAHILRWEGPYPTSGIQAAARVARWRLLGDWCREQGVAHLATAHHANDQAETILMRQRHGSGPEGLAGMRPLLSLGPVLVLRPVLTFGRDRLLATCTAAGLPVIDDPSNRDERFLRARLRAEPDQPARDAGLLATTSTRGATADRLAEAVARASLACAGLDGYGRGWLVPGAWADLAPIVRRTLLAGLVAAVAGRRYAPGRETTDRLEAWGMALAAGTDAEPAITSHGALLQQRRAGRVMLVREAAAIAVTPVSVSGSEPVLWDARFSIEPPPVPGEGWQIAPADAGCWRALGKAVPRRLRDLPARLRWTLPALCRDGRPMALLAPDQAVAGEQGWCCRFAPPRPWLRPW